uniref:Non-haem dioxygenase N-terminal domain-containing protein n=1 Tax=Kalanchoe fedtschenkoi TaxID=63787 RepID=A0A7N1A6L3_KALFE
MGAEAQIPVIDFSLAALKLGVANGASGDDQIIQDDVRTQVREACEVHGCFLLRCTESNAGSVTEDMFEGLRRLFDLPEDVKRRYQTARPYSSYKAKDPVVPLHESFGIDDAHLVESSQAFTRILWPQGNSQFCSALNGMSSRMLQLNLAMLKVIFESYQAGNRYESFAEKTCSVFR